MRETRAPGGRKGIKCSQVGSTAASDCFIRVPSSTNHHLAMLTFCTMAKIKNYVKMSGSEWTPSAKDGDWFTSFQPQAGDAEA